MSQTSQAEQASQAPTTNEPAQSEQGTQSNASKQDKQSVADKLKAYFKQDKKEIGKDALRAVGQVLLIFAAAFAGFWMIEIADNPTFWALYGGHVATNTKILFVLLAFVYFIFQRSRFAIAGFWLVCLLFGIAQHYVIMFKDQPILPADMFALETAAAVSGNYDYTPDIKIIGAVALFLACVFLLFKFVPRVKGYVTGKTVAVNLCCALLVGGAFYAWMTCTDIEADYDAHVGIWGARESYEEKGTVLCFIQRIQLLSPTKPEGYSAGKANELLEGQTETAAAANAAAEKNSTGTKPTVLCIMNETFSDLSYFPGLKGTAAETKNFNRIAQDSILHGYSFCSVSGGGTCNSEFEFLTGSSMCNIESSNYPYMMYDLDGNENLAAYFKSQGYSTWAMHPAEAKNWRRDRVYPQMGFENFDDIETFRSWADTIRGLVTDKATYKRCLDIIGEQDEPAFIFDVTLQNHSGYDTGQVPADKQVSLGNSKLDTPELDEYLSLVQQSDSDFKWLIEQLENTNEPVVLLMFGDHQASVSSDLFEKCYGISVDDATADQIQARYQTPYMIWANYDLSEGWTGKPTKCNATAATQEDTTSINYLGATLVETLGYPLTNFQSFLLENRKAIPAVNHNCYMDANGQLHGNDADPVTEADATALNDYAILQYANLFDKSAGKGLFLNR